MKTEPTIERLFVWQSAQAGAEAPPAPRAARLLELARPWWQRYPDRFSAALARFDQMHVRLAHAMETDASRSGGFPVPAVITRTNVETSLLADILYLHLRARRLRIRFHLPPLPEPPEPELEVTFVAADGPHALLSGKALLAPGGEYRLEIELSEEIAQAWAHLRVTEPMPFRFVLRPTTDA